MMRFGYPATMLLIVFLMMVSVSVSLFVSSTYAGQSPESREYKFLLKAKNFVDAEQGAKEYRKLVEETADELDVACDLDHNPKADKTRLVAYLDTSDFLLRASSHILRYRQKLSKKEHLDGKAELTLKFRSSDPNKAASANVYPAQGISGTSKFEEDVVASEGKLRRLYSRSADISVKEVGTKFKEFARLFPALAAIQCKGRVEPAVSERRGAIPPETKISRVNNILVREVRFDLGTLYFEKVEARSSISIWYKNQENKPFIAEFSFAFPTAGSTSQGLRTLKIGQAADRFALALLSKAAKWEAAGMTKTSLVYGSSGAETDE
jgi:hypothetical protein